MCEMGVGDIIVARCTPFQRFGAFFSLGGDRVHWRRLVADRWIFLPRFSCVPCYKGSPSLTTGGASGGLGFDCELVRFWDFLVHRENDTEVA